MALNFYKFEADELSLILRNLGNHENLNVKTLLNDFKEETKRKELEKKKKGKKGKYGKKSNKAQKIRQMIYFH